MTAEEARIIMSGSMQNKFVFYKSRLTFECGLINKAIDREARVGGWHVILGSTRAFAKKYFAHMAKLYEDKGFIVAYSLNLDSKVDSPEFHVYWDIAKMSREDMDRFLNTEYQTCVCYKRLGTRSIEAIKDAKKRVVEIRHELFSNNEVTVKPYGYSWLETIASCLTQIIDHMELGKRMDFNTIPAKNIFGKGEEE